MERQETFAINTKGFDEVQAMLLTDAQVSKLMAGKINAFESQADFSETTQK